MDENIFEAARRLGKANKDKAAVSEAEKNTNKNKDLSDLKVEDMMQKMKDMKNDLQGQLTEIYQKGSASNINVDHLIENSGGLAIKNLDKLREQEKILSDQINVAIPAESCLKQNQKNKETLTQERKGKLRGPRNNWIPVR